MNVRILTDSITDGGSRLTTWELTYARYIHAELMTHRVLSRNAASSRAIPAAKLRERTLTNPAVPVSWGANEKGMQAHSVISDEDLASAWWYKGLHTLAYLHEEGEQLGLHKQIVNRIIEPMMQITIICSGTDWANFFHLRNHKDAEPNFQALAKGMWEAYHEQTPEYLAPGEWHLPLISEEEKRTIQLSETLRKISVGRCARVSYLTHDGRRDISADIDLHDRLLGTIDSGGPGHMSPFEHVAVAVGERKRFANYEGWQQYRHLFKNENGPNTSEKCERCGCWAGNHTVDCPGKQGTNQPPK